MVRIILLKYQMWNSACDTNILTGVVAFPISEFIELLSVDLAYISEDWFFDDSNIMTIARAMPLEQYLYVGCNLGLDSQEVKRITQNHANNINVIPEILFAWRDTRARSNEDEKLGELLKALHDLELNSIVEKINDIYYRRK